jgi:hypothetical protein
MQMLNFKGTRDGLILISCHQHAHSSIAPWADDFNFLKLFTIKCSHGLFARGINSIITTGPVMLLREIKLLPRINKEKNACQS